ncbi:MAG: hypothetical protein RMI32_05450 [Candidatus Nitrosocaldus sp.]|nr:hypothetical protein [Candidatus Nitrosocaldus sp.]
MIRGMIHINTILLMMMVVVGYAAVAPYAYAQGSSMDDDLKLIVSIEEMRGHLMQALNNKGMGNDDLAVSHAGHPAAEYLGEIVPIVEQRSPELMDELRDRLIMLPSKVQFISYEELREEIDAIDALLEDASNLISDENKNNIQFWFEVIKVLLEHAQGEYEEGVEEEGVVSSIIEYQDAQAFVIRAENVFSSKVKNSISQDASSMIERFFTDAKSAIDEKRSADSLRDLIDGIMPVIPEFPVNLMLILVGVVASVIIAGRVLVPAMGSNMQQG